MSGYSFNKYLQVSTVPWEYFQDVWVHERIERSHSNKLPCLEGSIKYLRFHPEYQIHMLAGVATTSVA